MRSFISTICLFVILNSISKAQSYELMGPAGKDTVNLIDINNFKQGKWATRGMHQPTKGYKGDQLIEEGIYKDNMKIGEWIYYYNNGNIKNKILFVKGSMNGDYFSYHKDGTPFIVGKRISNYWSGPLKIHDAYGNILLINYDENGKELSKEFIKATK